MPLVSKPFMFMQPIWKLLFELDGIDLHLELLAFDWVSLRGNNFLAQLDLLISNWSYLPAINNVSLCKCKYTSNQIPVYFNWCFRIESVVQNLNSFWCACEFQFLLHFTFGKTNKIWRGPKLHTLALYHIHFISKCHTLANWKDFDKQANRSDSNKISLFIVPLQLCY